MQVKDVLCISIPMNVIAKQNTCAHTFMHTHIHMHIHTYIHTYTYICLYTSMCVIVCMYIHKYAQIQTSVKEIYTSSICMNKNARTY
jgi:hypothetical protein